MYWEVSSSRGTEVVEAATKDEVIEYITRTHQEAFGSLDRYKVKVITADKVNEYKPFIPIQNGYRQ